MTKNGHNPKGPQRWTCAYYRRERSKHDYWERGGRQRLLAQYVDRKDRGVCVRCTQPSLSSTLCWDCLNEMEERHAISLGPCTPRC